jgi:hypothetical protein
MSFDEILTFLCDYFDTLIAPKKMARSNFNILYLLLKATAKGYEIINNICVVLNNKFNPANCSSEDLESVSLLVGTKRLTGSASGLYIIVSNPSDETLALLEGTYYYKLDDNTTFYFDVLEDTEIASGAQVTFIAMSENIGKYEVTAQSEIDITSDVLIPSDLKFSCESNEFLLGTSAETDLELRKRIIEGTDNQDSIIELERDLQNLPYLFDARCKFNQEGTPAIYDGVTIPPFNLAIFYSGMARNEIANVVASKIICPTVSTEDSVEVKYVNQAFVNGECIVNLIPFKKAEFSIDITCKINESYAEVDTVKAQVTALLNKYFTSMVHKDYVREEDIYDVFREVAITGFTLLGANLIYNGDEVDYISIPLSRVPELTSVSFTLE